MPMNLAIRAALARIVYLEGELSEAKTWLVAGHEAVELLREDVAKLEYAMTERRNHKGARS